MIQNERRVRSDTSKIFVRICLIRIERITLSIINVYVLIDAYIHNIHYTVSMLSHGSNYNIIIMNKNNNHAPCN